jgi:hypothetical protein
MPAASAALNAHISRMQNQSPLPPPRSWRLADTSAFLLHHCNAVHAHVQSMAFKKCLEDALAVGP